MPQPRHWDYGVAAKALRQIKCDEVLWPTVTVLVSLMLPPREWGILSDCGVWLVLVMLNCMNLYELVLILVLQLLWAKNDCIKIHDEVSWWWRHTQYKQLNTIYTCTNKHTVIHPITIMIIIVTRVLTTCMIKINWYERHKHLHVSVNK